MFIVLPGKNDRNETKTAAEYLSNETKNTRTTPGCTATGRHRGVSPQRQVSSARQQAQRTQFAIQGGAPQSQQACSGIDIVSILKKQRQEITGFSAEVEGDRVQVDEAKPFKSILVKFFLEGNIDPKKALKSAELSFDKYCSVSKTLEPNVAIAYEVYVNGNLAN